MRVERVKPTILAHCLTYRATPPLDEDGLPILVILLKDTYPMPERRGIIICMGHGEGAGCAHEQAVRIYVEACDG